MNFTESVLHRGTLIISGNPRIVAVVVGLLVWAIWISGVLGNSGLHQMYRLSRARNDLAARVSVLREEHAHMQIMLKALERDRTVQEVAVRDTLGFVREGEIVFEF